MFQRHLRYTLLLAGFGVIILLLSWIFMSKKEMSFIGPVIGIVWTILTIASIRPYYNLRKISQNPEELIIRKSSLIYRGKLIHLNKIKTVSFIDKQEDYGLKFDMLSGSTLFLPYFTKNSFEELRKHLVSPAHSPNNERIL